MQTIKWDQGFKWDDPNSRWGDPSYLLQPGDPGYVAPPSTLPAKRKRNVKHNTFYPSRQADQVIWLTNYKNTLPGLASTLGLSSPQSTAAVADCNWLIYVTGSWLPASRAWSQACTDALTEAQTGTGSSAQVLPVFTAPALPSGVSAVNPGALTRIFDLVQQIKDSGLCTDVMATNLGIVGAVDAPPDLSAVRPVLAAKVNGSEVDIKWGWGGHAGFLEACEIHVDRGAGFSLLTIDTTPNYTDTQTHPGTKTIWSYKAIYRAADAQVGIWSAPVSVVVGA
jgi:hypothetical protein